MYPIILLFSSRENKISCENIKAEDAQLRVRFITVVWDILHISNA